MRRDEAFHAAAAIAIRRGGAAGDHQFQYAQQLVRHLEIGLISGAMKGDEHLV